MLRYKGYTVTFQEVPDEISIVVNVCGCPYHCKGCHSPHLWNIKNSQDLYTDLNKILNEYKDYATCFCFMGGEWDMSGITNCISYIKQNSNLKVCVYSGNDDLKYLKPIINICDYLKTGLYKKSLGGLDCLTTNQKFYKITNSELTDITSKFRRFRK